ncbi:FliH/SctL family protein [Microterricola viridarii]|uniref:Flagellar assembly protein FliH n=1 Tax=Microterricola viridarii TaxID=412690 RepID=A0A1H1W406_9MICO|nr:FliH/SctL family protein [Microterricola viridarii]SDS92028.1 flagellar assembly protein FliH [Microterricola viridarii]
MAFPSVDGAGAGANGAIDPAELALISERARVRGHAAGYAEGLRQADAAGLIRLAELEAAHAAAVTESLARLDTVQAVLGAAVSAVQRTTLPLLEQSDATLVSAAIELAEAVIGHRLTDGPGSAGAALQRVLSALAADAGHPDVIVHLHQDDLALLQGAGQIPQGLTVQADATLRRGDASAVLPDGFVDARIESALHRATLSLLEETA